GVPPTWLNMSKATFLSSVLSASVAGFGELMGGAYKWRVWHMLGVSELRHRYARSRFGQGWVGLATGIISGAMAIVWSLLWNTPLHDLMPFMGTSVIVWGFLSQTISDCTTVFVAQRNYYRNQRMHFSVSIYSVIHKNMIILAHNFILVIVLI